MEKFKISEYQLNSTEFYKNSQVTIQMVRSLLSNILPFVTYILYAH